MVFGPITIFRFSRMAACTSASHTKSTGLGVGFGGGATVAGWAGSTGHAVVSQPYPPWPAAPRRARKRSTTSFAAFDTTA
jgi:hypothetical protein